MNRTVRRVALAAALCATAASAAAEGGRLSDLLPLSRAQITAAGAAGTGCAWLDSSGRRTLFAAADDHAAVRLAAGVVELRPAADAKDMFPFTFDRWEGGGLTVSVRSVGRVTRRGVESMKRPAVLSVRMGDAVVERRGVLDCGS